MKTRWRNPGRLVAGMALFGLVLVPVAHAAESETSERWQDPVVSVVQRVLPAVVNISTERIVARAFRDPFEDFWRQFWGQPPRESEGAHSLGSGVIVDEEGWIVTNFHVTRRASKIRIQLADGTAYEAQFISGDERNDLALLKIEPTNSLLAVEIAAEREPMLGETVIAVGNPFGLDHTVTRGIISAKNRRYTAGDVTFEDIIQTDAAINPGNSGGPLINLRGELVGINMAILSQAEGIGFAIPARRVAQLLATWLTPEKRARLWFGVRWMLDDGRLRIAEVQAGSPAARAKLEPGDEVMTVDGREFRDVLRLQRHLIRKQAGESVQLRLADGRQVTVKLETLPRLSAQELLWSKFGISAQPLTRDLAEALGISYVPGLLVADVRRGSPAAEAGFRRGLVITHIGGEEFQSWDRLGELLADVQRGDRVPMVVLVSERRGNFLLQQTTSVTLVAE
ncbi:MAG: trypsin-like peptidase domain-containing protein [Verrucomicrobiae bacterium]|nr:trypsin-like peptidase domain-containing protein [Verrucomicrobiae bacterium]